MQEYKYLILISIIFGTISRIIMLKVDYRRYPNYPHGYMIHFGMGIIASALGAVALPSLIEKDFAAVTFLALAAQQFREIRKLERDSLEMLEHTQLVGRGQDYIEGIAKVFEGRNYLTIFNALVVSIAYYLGGLYIGIVTGFLGMVVVIYLKGGKNVKDLALVREAQIIFKGANLFVDDIHIMNVGLTESRKVYLDRALGAILEPIDDDGRATLANVGQRKAICHDVSSLIGVYRDVDKPEFMPLARLDLETGRVGIVIVPIEKDVQCFLEAIRKAPVLESAIRKPLKTQIGKAAAD